MSALTEDGSKAGCENVGVCLGVFFVAHGLRRWEFGGGASLTGHPLLALGVASGS